MRTEFDRAGSSEYEQPAQSDLRVADGFSLERGDRGNQEATRRCSSNLCADVRIILVTSSLRS